MFLRMTAFKSRKQFDQETPCEDSSSFPFLVLNFKAHLRVWKTAKQEVVYSLLE